MMLPSQEPLSSSADHEPLPVQVHQEVIPDSPLISPLVDNMVTSEGIERSTTPPPPSSSPPPLSPIKGDDISDDNAEEPERNKSSDHDSSSSLDTDQFSSVEDLFNKIDQSANHSNLSAIAAKGINDSLGTVSNLSEDITVSTIVLLHGLPLLPWQGMLSDQLSESYNNSTHPPPLPLSPPPDL